MLGLTLLALAIAPFGTLVHGQKELNISLAVAQEIYVPKPNPVQCAARFRSSEPVTILMVADDGTFSGTSEAVFYLDLLQNKYAAPAELIPCQSFVTGTLLGQPVVVITSGIGPEAAALCVAYVIGDCAEAVKELIYSGTAGWSPQVGGALNAISGQPGCTVTAAPTSPSQLIRFGDVAVTPYSVNWDCKLATWSEQCNQAPNICTYPIEEAGPDVTSLYGQCIFTTRTASSTALSEEIYAASLTPQFAANALALQATFNATLLPFETAYFAATAAGLGMPYPKLPAWVAPTVYNYTNTIELDAQFFFGGTPYDMVARNYSALALNMATGTTAFTQANVFAVNAEEGIGVSAAVDAHNALEGSTKVAFTFVRGNSDVLYPAPQEVSPGVYVDSPNSPAQNFDSQYAFAIQTTSTIVLTALQLRCLGAGNSASFCAYTLAALP